MGHEQRHPLKSCFEVPAVTLLITDGFERKQEGLERFGSGNPMDRHRLRY